MHSDINVPEETPREAALLRAVFIHENEELDIDLEYATPQGQSLPLEEAILWTHQSAL
jgi:hypothetical protein